MKEKILSTDDGESLFKFRLNKEESIGIAITKSEKNYLLFDSIDYWYDSIQTRYPSELKCKCKNTYFTAKVIYYYRNDNRDINKIELITRCSKCEIEKKQLILDIDYSPTDRLYQQPLHYCAKPNIKYSFTELSLLWTPIDSIKMYEYLVSQGMLAYAWYFSSGKRIIQRSNNDNAISLLNDANYLRFYFTENENIDYKNEDPKGVWVDRDIWRAKDIIVFNSPICMNYKNNKQGYLYYINYCTEYIRNYSVQKKSQRFIEVTNNLINWLNSEYGLGHERNRYYNMNEVVRLKD